MRNKTPKPAWVPIGTRIKEARIKAGYSQMAIAKEANMGQTTMGLIERGICCPRASVLEIVARKCGTTTEYLKTGVEPVKDIESGDELAAMIAADFNTEPPTEAKETENNGIKAFVDDLNKYDAFYQDELDDVELIPERSIETANWQMIDKVDIWDALRRGDEVRIVMLQAVNSPNYCRIYSMEGLTVETIKQCLINPDAVVFVRK